MTSQHEIYRPKEKKKKQLFEFNKTTRKQYNILLCVCTKQKKTVSNFLFVV